MEEQIKFKSADDFNQLVEQKRKDPHPVSLLLDRLTNIRNIAACFRLADAANLAHIYAYQTETVFEQKKFKRIARSTQRFIPYSTHSMFSEIEHLKQNHQIIALERTDHSVDYRSIRPEFPLVLIIGNEINGVSATFLRWAHHTMHLPMHGINNSMNASMAAGIGVYKLLEYL